MPARQAIARAFVHNLTVSAATHERGSNLWPPRRERKEPRLGQLVDPHRAGPRPPARGVDRDDAKPFVGAGVGPGLAIDVLQVEHGPGEMAPDPGDGPRGSGQERQRMDGRTLDGDTRQVHLDVMEARSLAGIEMPRFQRSEKSVGIEALRLHLYETAEGVIVAV